MIVKIGNESIDVGTYMSLFTEPQIKSLLENGISEYHSKKNVPYAHFIDTKTKQEWLITELYANKLDIAYGLIYKSKHEILLGEIDISYWNPESQDARFLFNNLAFYTNLPISTFEYVSKAKGSIITNVNGYESLFKEALNL